MLGSPFDLQGVSQWLGFILGAGCGLIVQGEGQNFFVCLFQPLAKREKILYDLNPMHHIDPLAVPVILVTGWGWGKKRVSTTPYFPPSRIAQGMVPLAGALACLFLAGIIGTLDMLVPWDAFKVAVQVNVLFALANLLIPIPPLGLGRALCCPLADSIRRQAAVEYAGGVVVLALVLVEYVFRFPLLAHWISALEVPISRWILHT